MIRVGTCSWTEHGSSLDSFYPRGTRTAEERLRYYASVFDTVEIDSTFYALPAAAAARLWAERTPPGFTFHAKAPASLTGHAVDAARLPEDIRSTLPAPSAQGPVRIADPAALDEIGARFSEALGPLAAAGRLGLVVFQFPPWLRRSPRSLDAIRTACARVAPLRAAVEFRHGSWLEPDARDAVVGFLKEAGLVYVPADEPQFPGGATVPLAPAVADGSAAYVRFHGRNAKEWFAGRQGGALRYDYSYSDTELEELVPILRGLDGGAATVFAMFNNCHAGQAMRNARRLRAMLSGAPEPPPPGALF